jgi:hypothetical protein
VIFFVEHFYKNLRWDRKRFSGFCSEGQTRLRPTQNLQLGIGLYERGLRYCPAGVLVKGRKEGVGCESRRRQLLLVPAETEVFAC